MVLITSKFHIDRCKVIFNFFIKLFKINILIDFCHTLNDGITETILNDRKKRETQSICNFQNKIINKIKTLHDFTKWFYTEHNAYKSIIEYIPMTTKSSNTY